MRSTAPRRPRRWSWAVLRSVALGLGFVALAAMVAWPERHARVFLPSVFDYRPARPPASYGSGHEIDVRWDYVLESATVRLVGLDAPRTFFESNRRRVHYRAASFSVILGDLLE